MDDPKIAKLIRLMCQWNGKEWVGRESKLLYKIWGLFENECCREWHKSCFRKRIRREMIIDELSTNNKNIR